jgi:hypothetical protein
MYHRTQSVSIADTNESVFQEINATQNYTEPVVVTTQLVHKYVVEANADLLNCKTSGTHNCTAF